MLRRLGHVLTVGLLFFLILEVVFALKIYMSPQRKNLTSRAPYALVLGATAHGWQPTPVFLERILEGVRLYQEGRVQKIIFTGKPGMPPQSLVAKKIAEEMGVPRQDILVEVDSNTTFENLIYAQKLVTQNPKPRFLIVSDPFHLERAMLMARDLKIQAEAVPTRSTQVRSFYAQSRFLLREILAMSYYLAKRSFKF